MTTTRTLAATLAIAALVAPAAQARPADIHARAAANARAQDLNHLRAGGDSINAPGATAPQPATRGRLPGPPTWPTNPQPIAPAHADKARDNGINPTRIALGIAGGLLALAGLVGMALRTRRLERTRITA